MAHDDDVIVRIEFLMSARRNVTHGDVFCSFDVGGFVFPGLANIEQRKCFAILLKRLDLSGRDFEVHNMILFVETGQAPSHAGARRGKPRLYGKSDILLSKLSRIPQRGQTYQRGYRPECASSDSSAAHIGGWNVTPQRQPAADDKIDNQQAEEHALPQAARVERKTGEQEDPHDVGGGGPEVVRPFVLIANDAAERNPREVGAAEEAGHAP